jgi:hypothetical protein
MNCSLDFRRHAQVFFDARQEGEREKLAGWVARTRPLAEPLSPRGPQPVLRSLRCDPEALNGPPEPRNGVPESWYALFTPRAELARQTFSCYITYLFSMFYRKHPVGVHAFLEGFRTTSSSSASQFMELGSIPAGVRCDPQQEHNPPKHKHASHPELVSGKPEFLWKKICSCSKKQIQPGGLSDASKCGVCRSDTVVGLAQLLRESRTDLQAKRWNHCQHDQRQV